jgi:hypothetical protein
MWFQPRSRTTCQPTQIDRAPREGLCATFARSAPGDDGRGRCRSHCPRSQPRDHRARGSRSFVVDADWFRTSPRSGRGCGRQATAPASVTRGDLPPSADTKLGRSPKKTLTTLLSEDGAATANEPQAWARCKAMGDAGARAVSGEQPEGAGNPICGYHAAALYSWMRPSSTSRRRAWSRATSVFDPGGGSSIGGRWWRERWGRCLL